MLKLEKSKANPTNCLNPLTVGNDNREERTELSHLLSHVTTLKKGN